VGGGVVVNPRGLAHSLLAPMNFGIWWTRPPERLRERPGVLGGRTCLGLERMSILKWLYRHAQQYGGNQCLLLK
jgi:hypothetical protein